MHAEFGGRAFAARGVFGLVSAVKFPALFDERDDVFIERLRLGRRALRGAGNGVALAAGYIEDTADERLFIHVGGALYTHSPAYLPQIVDAAFFKLCP